MSQPVHTVWGKLFQGVSPIQIDKHVFYPNCKPLMDELVARSSTVLKARQRPLTEGRRAKSLSLLSRLRLLDKGLPSQTSEQKKTNATEAALQFEDKRERPKLKKETIRRAKKALMKQQEKLMSSKLDRLKSMMKRSKPRQQHAESKDNAFFLMDQELRSNTKNRVLQRQLKEEFESLFCYSS